MVNSELWWSHRPGDAVTTVEGYPGTVEAVLDGPGPGNEHYEVTLDNNLGGGTYSSQELRPRTASKTAEVATESYPELGDILDRKPPPPHSISAVEYLAGLLTGADALYGAVTALHKQADDGGDHSHSAMVALPIPPEVASKIAVPGGLPPEQMHVTLAYLPSPSPEQLAAAHDVVANHAGMLGPIDASVGGAGQFPAGEDGVPHYAPVDAPGDVLPSLHGSLVTALEAAGVDVAHDHGFTPHSTRTYLLEGEPAPDPVEPTQFQIPSLVLAQGDDWTHYPLTGAGEQYDESAGEDPEADTTEDQFDQQLAASKEAGFWSGFFGNPPASGVNYDWCKFRFNQRCIFPKNLDVQKTLQTGQARWVPQMRGRCGRDWNQQSQCPISEPGPNARQLGVAAKDPRFAEVGGPMQDDDGWYVQTHRARSKSYPSPEEIPDSEVEFIRSTGASTETEGKPGITFHILPAHAGKAHAILQAEIAALRGDQDPDATVEALLAPRELIDAIHKNGGFSVKDHLGDGPKAGYMVSKNKSTEQAFPEGGFGPQHIQGYLDQHQKELASPNAYFGAWHDPESKKVYLDVSHHYPDFEKAKQVGRNAHQLALYDVGEGKTVYIQAGLRRAYFASDADPHDVLDFLGIEGQ